MSEFTNKQNLAYGAIVKAVGSTFLYLISGVKSGAAFEAWAALKAHFERVTDETK